MFGRNKGDEDKKEILGAKGGVGNMATPPLKPFTRRGVHAPSNPAQPTRLDVPRRIVDIPGAPRRDLGPSADSDVRKLVVGREICLKGEITACEKLVVQGQVEVALNDARTLDVARDGVFKGEASVEDAIISGEFDGKLTAHGMLTVCDGGRVSGTIRYGKIVIESGGEISGDMRSLNDPDKGGQKEEKKKSGKSKAEKDSE